MMDVTYSYTGLCSPLTGTLSQKLKLMSDLTNQAATKMKSPTYAGVSDRSLTLFFQSAISQNTNYTNTITTVTTRLNLVNNSIENMSSVSANLSSGLDRNVFLLTADGTTAAQTAAKNSLDSYVTSLNTDYDGVHLFGGRKTDAQPVAEATEILDGDASHAGYNTVAAQRLVADLGANKLGRLDPAVTGTTVSLTEEGTGTNVFGMKLDGASTTMTGANITGGTSAGAAPHSFSIDLTAQPNAGETLTLTLKQPDGTSSTLTLTAGTTNSTDGTTFAIGTSAAATAANLEAALQTRLATIAASDTTAASAVAAANDFFDIQNGAMPKRVDLSGGATLATATGLVDGTAADTVLWYRGTNDATSARGDASARIDTSVSVDFGVRANEKAFTDQIKVIAVMATIDVSGGTANDKLLYGATVDRVKPVLTDRSSAKSLQAVETEMVGVQQAAKLASNRLKVATNTYQASVDASLQVDDTTLAVQISTLQTQIESSYKAASILYKLSLVDYM